MLFNLGQLVSGVRNRLVRVRRTGRSRRSGSFGMGAGLVACLRFIPEEWQRVAGGRAA